MNKLSKIITFFIILSMALGINSQTVYLFSHGLADSYKQAYKYMKSYKKENVIYNNDFYLLYAPCITFNYPDVYNGIPPLNRKKTSLGQENEIHQLKINYEKTISYLENKPKSKDKPHEIVLFGLSRGACAALNYTALYNPSYLKALILESPFDSVGSIIDNVLKKQYFNIVSHKMGQKIMGYVFGEYKENGLQSINLVDKIPKKLPVLMICSREDQRVPLESTIALYKKLKKIGHEDVYLFITDSGQHGRILWGNDGARYQEIVHAFYKKYNLKHDPEIALRGKDLLFQCENHQF